MKTPTVFLDISALAAAIRSKMKLGFIIVYRPGIRRSRIRQAGRKVWGVVTRYAGILMEIVIEGLMSMRKWKCIYMELGGVLLQSGSGVGIIFNLMPRLFRH